MSDPVTVIRASERIQPPEGQTPGMIREEAIAGGNVWVGLVRTEPGMVSGWHHHNDHETYFYVLSGKARLEFGPGGKDVVEGAPGDWMHVPRETIHRESNPSTEEAQLALVRVGTGEVVVNVDGPE